MSIPAVFLNHNVEISSQAEALQHLNIIRFEYIKATYWSPDMRFDALVIGGGPAGSTIAVLLARAGWKVAIVEKKIFPRRKVCGEFISAVNLPLLHKLGVGNFFLSHSGPEIRRVGLFAGDAILVSSMPESAHSAGKWGRALGREQLDFALLNAASKNGASCWQGWNALELQGDARKGFTCTLEHKQQRQKISAAIVIIAHGSWERDLSQLSLRKHCSSDLLGFKAHFRDGHLEHDLMPLLAFPGGYGGLVTTDNDRVSFSCCIRRDTVSQARKKYAHLQAGEVVLQHVKASCSGVQKILAGASLDNKWLAAGPLRVGIRKCYQDGLFFVGNMAGEAHPIIAEGISMAMQSSWLLSQILISRQEFLHNAQELIRAGEEYTHLWRLQFARRIHASSLFAHIAMHPFAVSVLLPLFKLFPQLLTHGAKLSGKVQPLNLGVKP